MFLIAFGLAHTPLLIDGSGWAGPLSWRKPILFGVSTGLTLISIAWLLPAIRQTRLRLVAGYSAAIAAVLEVILIALQTWRGTPSHFNRTTGFDAFVDDVALGAITIVCVAIFVVGASGFRRKTAERMGWSRDLHLAVRSGLVFLAVSCAVGAGMTAYGRHQLAIGASPELMGDAGVLKFVHGASIHAIQILPLAAWALARLKADVDLRYRAIASFSAAQGLFLIYALWQTAEGRARFDMDAFGAVLLAVTAIFVVYPLFSLLAAMKRLSERRSC